MSILAAIGEEREASPVVSIGYDLAEAFDEQLHVLHVVPEEEYEAHREAITQLSEFSEHSFTQEADSAARFAKAVLQNTIEEYDTDRVETVGRVGDPVEEVHAVADDLEASYVVIGGRKRSPTGKAIFGSRTQSILLNADRPVVTVMEDE